MSCDCCGQLGQRLFAVPTAPVESDEVKGEEIVIGDDEPQAEVQDNRTAPDPFLPSAAEVENHRITHMPYRS